MKFVKAIGSKNLGRKTIEKLVNKGIVTNMDLLEMIPENISFLGPNISKKIVDSVQQSIRSLDLPTLMDASGVFGRGIGKKKLSIITDAYPNIVDIDSSKYVELFQKLDGFASKTSHLASDGMIKFKKFCANLPHELVSSGVSCKQKPTHLRNGLGAGAGAGAVSMKEVNDITGKEICLTGFRDQSIKDFILASGGKIVERLSSKLSMVIRKDKHYTNKKTIKAESSSNITLLSQQEFINKYMTN